MAKLNRRQFARAAAVTLAAPLAYSQKLSQKDQSLRVGFIGVGGRGTGLLHNTLAVAPTVTVPAVCDIRAAHAQRAAGILTGAGRAAPELYTEGELHWRKMVERDDLDAVIIATPWRWHTPMAVGAMKNGVAAGVEVPCALSVEECWDLVNTSEETGTPFMMLENWSFRGDNLALLNMVRRGLFGEIVHVHCAHTHDCIDHWFFDSKTGADRWAAEYLLKYNRDQYPTHGVGPVLSWLDINCGDRFETICSMASGSWGINDYFTRRFGADHEGAKRTYAQGDIVTSMIRTAKGKTLIVNYDMQLPRPYDNRWTLQGTRGIYNEQREAIYLTGTSPGYHQWEPFKPYEEKHKHHWWKTGGAGHGGVDGVMLREVYTALADKKPLPLDVYDSVCMSAIVGLSGQSIAAQGKPVAFPDFTRGRWKTRKPWSAVEA